MVDVGRLRKIRRTVPRAALPCSSRLAADLVELLLQDPHLPAGQPLAELPVLFQVERGQRIGHLRHLLRVPAPR